MAIAIQAVVSLDTRMFTSGIRGLEASINQFAGLAVMQFGGVAQQVAAMWGAFGPAGAAITTLGQVVQAGAELEQQMARVASYTGMAADEIKALQRDSMELAGKYGFAANEIGGALANLALAGLDTKEALSDVLRPSLMLAKATLGDTQQAAEAITSTLKVFQLGMEDATHVADMFAGAIASSPLDMQRLTDAMKYAGPAASAYGMAMEQAIKEVAALHQVGQRGQMAGTVFRGAIMEMAKAARSGAGEVGRALAGWNVSTEGLTGAVRRLNAAGVDTATVIEEVGKRAGPGVAALMKYGADAMDDLAKKVERTADVEAMHEKQVNTLQGQYEILKGKMAQTAIEIYDKLLPGLMECVKVLQSAVDGVSALAHSFSWLGDVLSGALPLILRVSTAFMGVNAAIKAANGLGASMGGNSLAGIWKNAGDNRAANAAALAEAQQGIREAQRGLFAAKAAERYYTGELDREKMRFILNGFAGPESLGMSNIENNPTGAAAQAYAKSQAALAQAQADSAALRSRFHDLHAQRSALRSQYAGMDQGALGLEYAAQNESKSLSKRIAQAELQRAKYAQAAADSQATAARLAAERTAAAERFAVMSDAQIREAYKSSHPGAHLNDAGYLARGRAAQAKELAGLDAKISAASSAAAKQTAQANAAYLRWQKQVGVAGSKMQAQIASQEAALNSQMQGVAGNLQGARAAAASARAGMGAAVAAGAEAETAAFVAKTKELEGSLNASRQAINQNNSALFAHRAATERAKQGVGALGTGMSGLALTFNVLGAAIIGWQIGKWFVENTTYGQNFANMLRRSLIPGFKELQDATARQASETKWMEEQAAYYDELAESSKTYAKSEEFLAKLHGDLATATDRAKWNPVREEFGQKWADYMSQQTAHAEEFSASIEEAFTPAEEFSSQLSRLAEKGLIADGAMTSLSSSVKIYGKNSAKAREDIDEQVAALEALRGQLDAATRARMEQEAALASLGAEPERTARNYSGMSSAEGITRDVWAARAKGIKEALDAAAQSEEALKQQVEAAEKDIAKALGMEKAARDEIVEAIQEAIEAQARYKEQVELDQETYGRVLKETTLSISGARAAWKLFGEEAVRVFHDMKGAGRNVEEDLSWLLGDEQAIRETFAALTGGMAGFREEFAKYGKDLLEVYRIVQQDGITAEEAYAQILEERAANALKNAGAQTADLSEKTLQLADRFAGMSRGQITQYVDGLKNLKNSLEQAGLANVNFNFGWMQQLASLLSVKGSLHLRGADRFLVSQFKLLAEAAQQLAAANIQPADLAWVEWLGKLNVPSLAGVGQLNFTAPLLEIAKAVQKVADMKIPADALEWVKWLDGFTLPNMGAWKGAANAIVGLAKAVNSIQIDSDKLDFLGNLADVASIGNTSLTIEWKDRTLMDDISSALTTLAGLKGIVWA